MKSIDHALHFNRDYHHEVNRLHFVPCLVSTTVGVADGELVLIGGLTQDKNIDTNSSLSFLPKIFHTKGDEDSRTEVILLIQVSKIDPVF